MKKRPNRKRRKRTCRWCGCLLYGSQKQSECYNSPARLKKFRLARRERERKLTLED